MPSPAPYRSGLYRDFFSIAPDDYQRMIRFFEEKEAEIGRLDGVEHFDLLLAYVEALFATGAYRKHLMVVDWVIEASLQDHLPSLRARSVFRRMLFRKAAAHYQIKAYAHAEHVLQELLRIAPDYPDAAAFLRKVRRKQEKNAHRLSRAGGIIFFSLGMLVFTLELLVVRPFYAFYEQEAELLRYGLFFCGLASLAAGGSVAYLIAYLQTDQFVASQKTRQKTGEEDIKGGSGE